MTQPITITVAPELRDALLRENGTVEGDTQEEREAGRKLMEAVLAFVRRQEEIPDAEMLAMATAFDVLPYDPARVGVRLLRVEQRGPVLWAIVDGCGLCLSRDNEWEYERQPSSRTDAFLAVSRWPTARDAIAFARKWAAERGLK